MGRRKELPVFSKVEITDAGSEGKAVARVNDRVIFIPFVVPGDIVDVKVVRKKRSFFEGRAIHIHHYSDKRTEAVCDHYGTCGGCKWQNMDYKHQLFYKQKQVRDNFERLGKFDFPEILPILPSDEQFYYRNKLEYTFSNRRWLTEPPSREAPEENMNGLGFHLPGMFDRILDIQKCYLQNDLSNDIRLAVRDFALENKMSFYDVRKWEGLLRNLIIRNTSTGEWMVIVVFHHEHEQNESLLNFIMLRFPELTSLMYVINGKKNDDISDLDVVLYSGQAFITEELPAFREGRPPLQFRIGPLSFFQTNTSQASVLYRTAAGFAGFTGDETVYDLYSGTGTIACYIAPYVKKVVGLEYIPSAIEDAKRNAGLNNITNTEFHAGDILKIMDDSFIEKNGRPGIVITDPPRAGMHEKVVRQILKIAPEKIVYVSCNPATQARDIAILSGHYRVEKVQPVDMFPQTQHVENVALLVRGEA